MDSLLQKLMLGGSTAALMAAMSVSAANAQGGGGGDIEQVVVSASRVTIAGYSQPTPVTVVGAAQLEKDAYANITDAVRNLPQVNAPPSSFGIENGGASQGSEGENILNLRNLGVIRTLVLFDNQRVVAANITGGVDVGVIPSAVVSRVDVVTGGASASWGSDAVAGVVNFVLNKNFTGWKSTVQVGDDYRDTNESLLIQSAWGDDIFGGRGHLVVAGDMTIRPDATLGYYEKWNRNTFFVCNPAYNAVTNASAPQLILANDVGLANATTGGIINSSPAGTSAAANALRGIEFVGNGIPQLVNYGNLTLGSISNGGSLTGKDGEKPWGLISAPNQVYTAFGFFRYKLTDTIQASLQLNYGYFTGKDFAQSNLQTALVIKSDNAFIPASVKATMVAGGITSFTMGTVNGNNFSNYTQTNGDGYFQNTAQDIAPATEINHRQMMRAVATLEGTLGEDWSWTAYYAHSTVRYWSHILGSAIVANLNNAEDAVTVTTANRGTSNLPLGAIVCRSSLTPGTPFTFSGVTAQAGCIPVDVFGEGVASPNAVRYITGGMGQDFEHMQTNEDVAEGSMQGTLPWELPAGKVAIVFGAGYRKEAGVNHATQLGLQAAYAVANFTNFPSAGYNVIEGFAEVDAPILKNNIVDSIDVQAAGRMTSYSTSGLVETWKLGATSQINQDVKLRTTWSVDIRSPSLTELFNPASINTGSTKDPKTGATVSFFNNVLGNPNLSPETARSISGGVVLTPSWIEGFSMSADWYNINLTGVIATLSTQLILNTCTTNINDPLCTHLIFGSPSGLAGAAGVGPLAEVVNSPLNIASLRTSGLDLQANYTMNFWEGTLAWQAVANYVDEITQSQPGSVTDDYAGVMGANSPSITSGSPKWKGVASVDYTTGPWSFTVQGRWFGTGIMNNSANKGNLATAATANLQSVNEVPFTAFLDLRSSYKWNENISFYGAIDNALNNPPPLLPQNSAGVPPSVPAQSLTYDLLGRTVRAGVRFNY